MALKLPKQCTREWASLYRITPYMGICWRGKKGANLAVCLATWVQKGSKFQQPCPVQDVKRGEFQKPRSCMNRKNTVFSKVTPHGSTREGVGQLAMRGWENAGFQSDTRAIQSAMWSRDCDHVIAWSFIGHAWDPDRRMLWAQRNARAKRSLTSSWRCYYMVHNFHTQTDRGGLCE